MKLISIFLFVLFFSGREPEKNYTGIYGNSESRRHLEQRAPGVSKEDIGHQSNLVLFRVENNQYKFWLYISRGYPNYNSGHIEGFIKITGDSAVFKDEECHLVFHFYNKRIEIIQTSEECGFGYGVFASGDYPKIKSKVVTNDIIDTYQFDIKKWTVSSSKAIIYKTPDLKAVSAGYFIKGDKVSGFEDEDDFIFVQQITKNNKYIEGWLKKSDLK